MSRPGAVRYKRNGEWIETSPNEPLYSAALFAAEEVLTDTGWEPIEGPTCVCGLGNCPDHDDDKQSVIYRNTD